jgi:hypothetical protein
LNVTQEDLEQDRVTRWQPDPRAVAQARAILATYGGSTNELAVIPMYQPGKERGIWEMGQQVVTVRGAIFTGNHHESGNGLLSYAWAREAAAQVAEAQLGDAAGTAAYAVVRADSEHTPVFEL